MKITEGASPYDSIRKNAFLHNANLDSDSIVSKEQIESTLNHLDDCIHNPTRGLLARREQQSPIPDSPKFLTNQKIMFNFPEVKEKNDIFESQYKKMYPKTGEIRKNLIENRYITLSTIKPKMTKFQKLIFRLFHF